MSRKGETVTLSLDASDKAALMQIAAAFGCHWGDKPNISELIKAIAQGRLKVYWSEQVPTAEVRSKQAKAALAKIQQGLAELSDAL